MAEAIRDYFKIPNATEAWLQGKRIFDGFVKSLPL
jgi:hypothetical protein